MCVSVCACSVRSFDTFYCLCTPTCYARSLGRNNVGDRGAVAIAKAVKSSRSITSLRLQRNGIDKEGGRALAEAIQANDSLALLNVSLNNLGQEVRHIRDMRDTAHAGFLCESQTILLSFASGTSFKE